MTLLAFYRNDGIDRSGNGHNLSSVGSPGTTAGLGGIANAAMSLQSSINHYSLAAQLIPAGSFSIACFGRILVDGLFGAIHQDLFHFDTFGLNFSSTTVEWMLNGNANKITVAQEMIGFHHLVGTWNGTTARLYIDAAQVGTLGVAPNFAGGFFAVGRDGSGEAALQYVGIFDSVLSPTEITQLYNGGIGLDPTITYALQAEVSQPARVPTLARPSRIPTLAVLPRV